MTFQQDIQVYVDQLGPSASQMLADAARQVRQNVEAEQSSRRGIKPLTAWATDGVIGRLFDEVKPSGSILLYWQYAEEIIDAAFQELRARAPVVSGRYRDSFFAILDGQALEPLEVPTSAQLENVKEIWVSNMQPYSRRLETGTKKDGSPFTAEPHIVQGAMVAVEREFISVASFDFNYIDLQTAYIIKTNTFAHHPSHRRDRGIGVALRYPAMKITFD